MPTTLYVDDILKVEVGVDMRTEVSTDNQHVHRDLTNSIKIIANSGEGRFIQFVTHLVPDMFAYGNDNNVIQWETDMIEYIPCYMKDSLNPRWKVDTASDTCFYDDSGAHIRTVTQTSMYDCPGGTYEPPEERSVFCTFSIINNQVTHKVKWSKQCDEERRIFYTVEVQRCEKLPLWALKTLLEDYKQTNGKSNEHKIYKLPDMLRQGYQFEYLSSAEIADEEARKDFLQPPDNWITIKKFPALFQPKLTHECFKQTERTIAY